MSRWGRRRQLIYLAIFVLIVAAIAGTAFYRYQPVESCTDGRQNGGETGIDCGGACAQVCKDEIAPLKIVWSRVLPISTGFYAAVARVENPNLEAGVRKLKYTFRLVGADNILVTYRSGTTFVNPGESFIVFEGGINTLNGRPTQAFFTFETPDWQKASEELPLVVVDSKTFINTAPARLASTINNRSITDLTKVEVTALLSDAAGNALTAGQTYIDNLSRESSQTAFFAWPDKLPLAPTFIDLYPRVSIFDF